MKAAFARVQNEMKRQAQLAAQSVATNKLAIVTSFDPNRYAAKVLLQPGSIETGWLPVKSAWVGNGWGLFCPPSPGDQVEVDFQEGSIEAGIVSGGLFSDEARPLPCPSGEFWLVHQSGSSLKFTNDGKVAVVSASDLNATVGGQLNATVTGKAVLSASEYDLTGDLNVTGNITSTKTISATQAVKVNGTTLAVP